MIMTPQEKAAAYDKAIERTRRMIEDYKNRGLENYIAYAKENIDYIFPELKESEGENMKKSLITFFRKHPYSIGDAGINPLDAIAWLEKQGERKPADKVEPNFKVGEWIIFDENPNSVYQVERIDNYRYYLRHCLGGTLSVHFDNELIRPWTIKDAKDGDVLYENDTKTILIFKSQNCGWIKVHCDYWISKDKYTGTDHADYGRLSEMKLVPATKEQRDILLQKMKEAGYTFDFDKKELKKIENEIEIPFGANDSELQEATYYIPKFFHAEIDGDKVVIKKGEKPTEWSEDDDSKLKEVLHYIEYVNEANVTFQQVDLTHLINFLKSLRPQNRWKPSDNELEVLRLAAEKDGTCLMGLYEQLKKLREE